MNRFLFSLATLLIGCATEGAKLSESQEALSGDCGAQTVATLNESVYLTEANYVPIMSACVGRATPGYIDSLAVFYGDTDVDGAAILVDSVDGVPVVDASPEVQLSPEPNTTTTIAGSVYVEPGKHTISMVVRTGGPGATIGAWPGTWLNVTARQQFDIP